MLANEMLATINFYNQLRSRAIKINNIVSNIFLPVKLIILQWRNAGFLLIR